MKSLPLAVFALIGIGATAAHAAVPTAGSILDWGSLLATPSAPDSFSVVSGSSGSFTNAFVAPGPQSFDSATNWSSSLASAQSGSGVISVSQTSALIGSTVLVGGGALPALSPSASAYSNAYRELSFTLAAGQSVTFSFDYSLATTTAGLPAGASYTNDVYALLLPTTAPGQLAGSDFLFQNTTGATSGVLDFPVMNTNSVSLTEQIALGGATYEYVNAVPEPETWALMLCGLVGLGFMARRHSASGLMLAG
jgi:hypothetical protein